MLSADVLGGAFASAEPSSHVPSESRIVYKYISPLMAFRTYRYGVLCCHIPLLNQFPLLRSCPSSEAHLYGIQNQVFPGLSFLNTLDERAIVYPYDLEPVPQNLLTSIQRLLFDWLLKIGASAFDTTCCGSLCEDPWWNFSISTAEAAFWHCRLCETVQTASRLSLMSPTFTHSFDVHLPLCPYELNGECRNPQCPFQGANHGAARYQPSPAAILAALQKMASVYVSSSRGQFR